MHSSLVYLIFLVKLDLIQTDSDKTMGVYSYQRKQKQKQKNKTWYFYKFMFESYPHQAWGFPTRTHAERAEAKKRTELLERRHRISVKNVYDPSFKDFAAKYVERLAIRSTERLSAEVGTGF